MEWSTETARKVLNYSLACPITDEEIKIADAAIQAEEAALATPDAANFSRMSTELQDVPRVSVSEELGQNENSEVLRDDDEPQMIEMLSEELLDMLWVTGMPYLVSAPVLYSIKYSAHPHLQVCHCKKCGSFLRLLCSWASDQISDSTTHPLA